VAPDSYEKSPETANAQLYRPNKVSGAGSNHKFLLQVTLEKLTIN